MAERADAFSDIRRAVWERYPDPLWHLRQFGPWSHAPDPFEVRRNVALARIPTLKFVDEQWEIERRVLGVARLRQLTREPHPRALSRPLTFDEIQSLITEAAESGAVAWIATEAEPRIPATIVAGVIFFRFLRTAQMVWNAWRARRAA